MASRKVARSRPSGSTVTAPVARGAQLAGDVAPRLVEVSGAVGEQQQLDADRQTLRDQVAILEEEVKRLNAEKKTLIESGSSSAKGPRQM